MKLTYDNLIIRHAVKEDANILCKWWNDGKIMAHAGFPNGLHTTEDKIIESLEKDSDNHRRLILELDDHPIGEMCFTILDHHYADIGIKICEVTHQEKGYGRKYLSMLITYLFEERNCAKIVLDTNLQNKRAQHVYESLGFRKLRINYDSWTDQLGHLQSSVDYELVKESFKTYL